LEQSRACTQCGQIRLLSEFDKHKKGKDGRDGRCKYCRQAYVRQWAASHKEIIMQRHYRRVAKDPEKERQRHRDYYHRTKDSFPSKSSSRRALKNQVNSEPYTTADVLNTYGSACHICNLPIDLDAPRKMGKPNWEKGLNIDHIIPLSKGGPDTLSNVKPAHGLCNARKGAR